MTRSEQINELAAALSKAQGEFPTVERGETARVASEKANYSYKYASLASVLEAIRAPLAKNGLALCQTPNLQGNSLSITLLLMHASGQFLEDAFTMPVAQMTPQGIGSAISYARRYQLLACLGLGTDDDDDGKDADPNGYRDARSDRAPQGGGNRSAAPKPKAEPTGAITEEQKAAARSICRQHGWDVEESAQRWFETSLDSLTAAQGADMIKKLNQSAKSLQAADARN